jgi:hypothetical protein
VSPWLASGFSRLATQCRWRAVRTENGECFPLPAGGAPAAEGGQLEGSPHSAKGHKRISPAVSGWRNRQRSDCRGPRSFLRDRSASCESLPGRGRSRSKTGQDRTRQIHRLGKLLESAGIKLSSIASPLTGRFTRHHGFVIRSHLEQIDMLRRASSLLSLTWHRGLGSVPA